MKNLLLFGIFLTFASILFAQVPAAFTYQGVARYATDSCISNAPISIRINILDSAANGLILYQEQHIAIMTNKQGLFSLIVGADPALATGAGQTTDFSSINWNNQSRWMQVEMDPNGGGSFVVIGVQELLTVPYAHAADNGLLYNKTTSEEYLPWYGPNEKINGRLGGQAGKLNSGQVEVFDSLGVAKSELGIGDFSDGSYGFLRLLGGNNNVVSFLGATGTSNYGYLGLFDPAQNQRVFAWSEDTWGGAGGIRTFGPNNSRNVEISIQSAGSAVGQNRGAISIFNEMGNSIIYLGNDALGNPTVTAAIKNFVMEHPQDSSKQIWYASIEGPEAAAYERGTAELVNGEAEIRFSEHFELVANPATMTVIVTPRSPESEGLAAFEYTENGFKVKELRSGTGSYQFDWEAKAVRKGYENYEVIREKVEVYPEEK